MKGKLLAGLFGAFSLMASSVFAQPAPKQCPPKHQQKVQKRKKRLMVKDYMSYQRYERYVEKQKKWGGDHCIRQQVRTYDGSMNNLRFPDNGKAGILFHRKMPATYGPSDPYNAMTGETRRSARDISNICSKQDYSIPSPYELSAMVFSWGQFLDHDLDLSAEGQESAPILLPSDEPLFNIPIAFTRSGYESETGMHSPRQQVNEITSWIDGSMVYGSDEDRANWLRTFQNGKLKTSSGNMLPYNTITGEYADPIDPNSPGMAGDDGKTVKVFVAGDVRANEQNVLTTLHVLFVREHNRICDELIACGITDDEYNYQYARKMVSGMIQQITFTEWLGALGIDLGYYYGYNSWLRVDISNVFATAAFRLGHTMVPSTYHLMDNQENPYGPGDLELKDAFFRPDQVAQYGIEPYLKGMAFSTQEKIDPKIVDGLRNFLFITPGATFGFDLASLNIQRGRDHGLPDYNTIRQHFLGHKASCFKDINPDMDVYENLAHAYDNDINNVDPWVGMISEKHIPGKAMGPTLYAILSDQFHRLRDADFYYFEHDPFMSYRMKHEIRMTTLSDILERNTGYDFRDDVFHNSDVPVYMAWRSAGASNNAAASSSEQLNLYPNPSQGNVTVELALEEDEKVAVEVLDLSGKVVFTSSFDTMGGVLNESLEMNLKPGVYMVKVSGENEAFSQRLVIQ